MVLNVSKVRIFVLALAAAVFAWPSVAHAHDPIFITDEQSQAEQGPFLPDARISFALYGTFNQEKESRGFQFEIPEGEIITLSLLIPDLEPENLIENQSLPSLVLVRPDKTALDLLPEIRVKFAEPYSGTNYVRLLDHEEIGVDGVYQVLVNGVARSRFTVSIGFIEMFGTPVENVDNRNDRGALSRWYRTPPLTEITPSSTTESLMEEKRVEEMQPQEEDKEIREAEEANETSSQVPETANGSTNDNFPAWLIVIISVVAVSVALLPLLKFREGRENEVN
ncbi:MAG: Uncharacterised protein [Acidimicrobiales bacterium AG-410-I20]|nr:MAG: Uncharacterised protein [Acidimicrobiales bacterium AG-410-I20]